MVLIISHDDLDLPTDMVIDWFRYLNFSDYLRLNGIDLYFDRDFCIDQERNTISYNDIEINIEKVNAIFYRRWVTNADNTPLYEEYLKLNYSLADVILVKDFVGHFSSEYSKYVQSIFSFFDIEEAKWLPYFKNARGLNKFEVLKIAKRNGLKIPKTIITSNRKTVSNFKNIHKRIISKPIGEVSFIENHEVTINMLTKEVTSHDIDELPETFFPGLFQNLEEKEFELRIFYLAGKFYSMAIFSQKDAKTKLDFRNYNIQRPNRFVPFKLPYEIENKLTNLMRDLGLSTGSIDMIYNTSEEYIFLEVNPVGQLGMVSENCNYYIEKQIAELLIRQNYECK